MDRATRDLVVLFGLTLLQLAALPFHVAWFLVRRSAIRREVRAALEGGA